MKLSYKFQLEKQIQHLLSALLWVKKAQNQAHNGSFAKTRLADDCVGRACLNLQIEVLKELSLAEVILRLVDTVVSEGDIVELKIATSELQLLCVRFFLHYRLQLQDVRQILGVDAGLVRLHEEHAHIEDGSLKLKE